MSAFAVREPEFEQRTGQVVKSGAEVVSKFAYNDTQSERRFRNVAVFEAVATGSPCGSMIVRFVWLST